MLIRIKETIVVEGRSDERAVKQAVRADVIVTSGFGVTEETFRKIAFARNCTGVIILTDPDHPGEMIRRRINRRIPGCRHAYISKSEARKGDDIGIENATPAQIRISLARATPAAPHRTERYTAEDLRIHRLSGCSQAAGRRDALGRLLGIGYANGKQFLLKLNHYGISRERFREALDTLNAPNAG